LQSLRDVSRGSTRFLRGTAAMRADPFPVTK
jgi:hypothetical protein